MSPNWYTNIPEEIVTQSLPIRRTPASKPITCIVTSADLIGTFTHFYRGRTTPCERPDCEACRDGQPWRYHAYVGAWSRNSGLHFIFEMTAQAAEKLIEFRTKYQSLRSCQIDAYRWGKRSNGRVILKASPSGIAPTDLPLEPDLVKCLSVLWNIPLPDLETGHTTKNSPAVTIAQKIATTRLGTHAT